MTNFAKNYNFYEPRTSYRYKIINQFTSPDYPEQFKNS